MGGGATIRHADMEELYSSKEEILYKNLFTIYIGKEINACSLANLFDSEIVKRVLSKIKPPSNLG